MRHTSLNKQTSRVCKYLIERHGFTVTKLAEVMGVDKSFASRCKNGEREYSAQQLDRLAQSVDMPVGALLLATEPPRDRAKESPQMAEIMDLAEEFMAKLDALDAKVKQQMAESAGNQ